MSNTPRTNFVIASYITARGRLQLINAMNEVDKAGYRVIYTDTDSIYAAPTDRTTPELYQKYFKPLIDTENKLGGFKLEMSENVGEDTATGVFVGLKLYALKGENTGKQKVVAKGVM